MSTMVHQRPHSPEGEHHAHFQPLLYNNGSLPFGAAFFDSPLAQQQQHQQQHPSHPGSLYNSPAFGNNDLSLDGSDPYAQAAFGANNAAPFAELTMPHDGLGIQYQQFGSAPQGNYFHAPGSAPYNYLPTGLDSPVSPAADSARRTRSGRSVARSSSPYAREEPAPRTSKSPRGKKTRASKASSAKTPRLDKPLSELTKDMAHIPIRNMQDWVNRPVETRQMEVEKRNGYVTRPMNSFMLYRSAYAERTKQWCLQNNHQIVSSVSGESWPLEPPEIRNHYNDLARQERENHARAHPLYKFSPSKNSAASRKKKSFSLSDDDEEVSEAEHDPDGEWVPGRGPRPAQRNAAPRRQIQETFPAYSEPPMASQTSPYQPMYAGAGPHTEFYPPLYQQPSSPMSLLSHAQSADPNGQYHHGAGGFPPSIAPFPGVSMAADADFFRGIQQQLSQQQQQQQPPPQQVDPSLLIGYHGHIKRESASHEEGIFGMDSSEQPGQFEHWMEI